MFHKKPDYPCYSGFFLWVSGIFSEAKLKQPSEYDLCHLRPRLVKEVYALLRKAALITNGFFDIFQYLFDI